MPSVETTKPSAHESDVFWGEISPCEHLVQIYQDEGVFLDALEGFIAGGILAGDGVVVIATPVHLASLNERLNARDIDVAGALKNDQYIALDAEETLTKFMVMGWPDEDFSRALVLDILKRAKGDKPPGQNFWRNGGAVMGERQYRRYGSS